MGVQLRIARPRGAVPERRRRQPGGRHDLSATVAASDRRRRALEIANGFERGAVVRATDRGARSPIPNRTLTLLGAEKVRSNPATLTWLDALDALRNGEPSYGSRPAGR